MSSSLTAVSTHADVYKDVANTEEVDPFNTVSIIAIDDDGLTSGCGLLNCCPRSKQQAFVQRTIRMVERLRIKFRDGFDHTNLSGTYRAHIGKGLKLELNGTMRTISLEESSCSRALLVKIIEIVENVGMLIASPHVPFNEQADKLEKPFLSADQQNQLLLPATKTESSGSTRWLEKLEQPTFLTKEEFDRLDKMISKNDAEPVSSSIIFKKH